MQKEPRRLIFSPKLLAVISFSKMVTTSREPRRWQDEPMQTVTSFITILHKQASDNKTRITGKLFAFIRANSC